MENNPEKLNNQEADTSKSDEQLRAEQGEKVIAFLDKINAFEYFKNLLSNKESEKPEFKEFEDFLVRINGIARDIPIHERTTDGENVHLAGFVEDVEVPRHEDKEEILHYAYDKGLTINKEDLKYLLPAVINAVHLFMDGNGRTSRIVHLLLRDYPSKEEFLAEAQKILGEYGRMESYDINPSFINYELQQEVLKRHGWIYDEENSSGKLGVIETGAATGEVRELDQKHPSYKIAQEVFKHYSDNGRYVLTAIHMTLGDEGVKNIFSQYGDLQRVSPKKMLEVLKPADWEKIISNFDQLKKEQAMMLVDIFAEPEKYTVSIDDPETLRELFIKKILEQKEGN